MNKFSIVISIFIGFVCVFLCSSLTHATPPFDVPPKGGLPVCMENLSLCSADLNTCETELAECEAEGGQIFPGDGFPNPDSFGLSGHGPALSYTVNGDGTFTDNNTGYMWDMKLAADGSEGGNCHDADQANRSFRCENNTYTWSENDADVSDPDGTLFTEFLAQVNANALGGFTDWCIPNAKKLVSILDYSLFIPSTSIPGANGVGNFYWSNISDPSNFGSTTALIVTFNHGQISSTLKTNNRHARAVRPCD